MPTEFNILTGFKELHLKAINKNYSVRFVHAVLPFDKITISIMNNSEMVIYMNSPDRLTTSTKAIGILANAIITFPMVVIISKNIVLSFFSRLIKFLIKFFTIFYHF